MTEAPILSGTLQDLELSMVMEVTSIGRQTLRLEVTSPTGALIGFVVLKAGRVIAAEAGTYRGQAALALILNAEAHAHFRVVRHTADVRSAAPVAMVGDPIGFSRSASSPFAEGTNPKIRVMEGSLSEFDIPTLLQTIGIGRSYMEVDVLSESGRTIGSVFLKAGKVVSAQAGSFEGLQAVRELIDCPRNFQFAVFRVDEEIGKTLQTVDPVGGLSQVLMEAQPRLGRSTKPREVTEAADRTPIMAGLLSEFDVPTLLQTLGTGRQFVGLEVHDNGALVGRIMVKAAMVMSASAGQLTGVAAFTKVVQSPTTCSFSVFRSNATPSGQPLGPMHRLLMSALDESAAAATAKPPALTMLGVAPPVVAPPAVVEPAVISQGSDGRVAVMAGQVSEFGMVTLLEVLTQNRQHTVVEIVRRNTLLGTIHLKAGMVCRATAGMQTGVPAFNALLVVPPDSDFCVYRETEALDISNPLGKVSSLVRNAATLAERVGTDSEVVESTPAAETAKGRRPWIGIGVGIAFMAAAGAFLLWPKDPVASQEVAMSVQASPPPAEIVPHDDPQPAEPAPPVPPVQQTKPAEPAPPVPPVQPVQQTKPAEPAPPVPPVQQTKPAEPVPPVPPVQQTKPAKPAEPAPTTASKPAVARRVTTRAAQAILAKLGYPVGPIDNVFGPKTREAVRAFQQAEGLDPTGTLNTATIQALVAK